MGRNSGQFRFQRFAVDDNQCGMKIGTDAVLLGAWANVKASTRILDIGTGCGLIALMIAQRTETKPSLIDAIDREEQAVAQALQNVAGSPWADRIFVEQQPLRDFVSAKTTRRYDLCVCNPPFFNDSFPSRDPDKRIARHSVQLSRQQLIESSRQLLKMTGRLCLILPFDQLDSTVEVARDNGFFLQHQTSVRPLPDRPFKRVLLEFGFAPVVTRRDELSIEITRHEFTAEYESLTRQFHLRYASQA